MGPWIDLYLCFGLIWASVIVWREAERGWNLRLLVYFIFNFLLWPLGVYFRWLNDDDDFEE